MVISDARFKLEKEASLAMPCIVREESRGKPQTCTTLTDASMKQSESDIKGACGKVMRKCIDHIVERCTLEVFTVVGSFYCFLVHMPVFFQESLKIPQVHAAINREWDQLQKLQFGEE